MRKLAIIAVLAAFSAPLIRAGSITYTCDTTLISDGTCATLNTTIAGLYSAIFTNATAKIYIQYGTTDLASTEQYYTNVSYTNYVNALTTHEHDANDVTAVASLGGNTTNPVVAGDGVALSSALAVALGLNVVAGSVGINTSDSSCILGTNGCYNAIVTVSNAANTWYYRNGSQASGTYDIYSAIEHETDEVLGTFSCLTTASGNPATSVGCTNGSPSAAVSAADLFRYSAAGTRSYLSTADGSPAYFSINGGVTDVANYNNSPNGGDYGDWNSSSLRVQNAFGTPGVSGTDITNDGGSEIAVLDAVGYTLAAPEPGTFLLSLTALGLLVFSPAKISVTKIFKLYFL